MISATDFAGDSKGQQGFSFGIDPRAAARALRRLAASVENGEARIEEVVVGDTARNDEHACFTIMIRLWERLPG